MSIIIRPCEHSAETSSRAYVKNPDVCVTCAYQARHGAPKGSYDHNADTQKRTRHGETMRKIWAARKMSQAKK